MTELLYTEADGLTVVTRLDPDDYPVGTIIHGRITSLVSRYGWFKKALVTDSLIVPYHDWEPINKNHLPKRLKMEALIMDVKL